MKENKNLEFKEIVNKTFLKTVAAFANYGGGQILFGVNDEGESIGIINPDETCLDIENTINDSITPRPEFLFSIDRKTNVITLTIKEGLFKPYLYKGKAYKRSDTSTVEVDQIELRRLVLLGENLYFEQLPSKKQDLTFDFLLNEIDEHLLISKDAKDIDILRTLGLMDKNSDYNNAACLLADENIFPGIDMVKFGSNINEIEYRTTIYNVSVLDQLKKAEEVFLRYYKVEQIVGMKRKAKFLIPLEAFRETVANALVHRTWDISPHIRISMYDDRIEVYSPGGLPIGLTKEDYISGYVSMLRNPIIANVFFRLDIIEKFGTGILRIKKAYYDIKHQPIFDVTENSVVTILPTENKLEDFTVDEEKVFESLSNGFILSSSEISELTGFGKDKVLNLLKELIEKGYIEKLGSGRGTKYKAR
ncbi:ATP-binding protein [Facklamia sp. 7083-14-GEN3]|uniref:ATP-binding protein n=1 Tax=Facklamia sp. 7083-14-GEN3 TaxID=2973478 RepID=UPI00215CDB5E|nr:ATP-binding protein [Facklamia sp. 7083-14-GEN3]MCR8969782.1 putative DNA binding domain-containing protein [Facklamia sp. 7083-14-GEN3]